MKMKTNDKVLEDKAIKNEEKDGLISLQGMRW